MMKIINNTKFKKIMGIFLVVVVLITGIGPSFTMPKAYAGGASTSDDDSGGGMLAWAIAKFLSWVANIIQDLLDTCFGIPDGDPSIFISTIVYGEIDAFDINIFSDTTLSGHDRNVTNAHGKPAVLLNKTVGATIAKYYGFCRTLAIAASLVILLYVGIRIVVSTAAGDLTKYKSLLKDWLLSLALVLMMHYIMSLVLFTCDSLTVMFKNLAGVGTGASTFDFYEEINKQIDTNPKNMLIYSVIKMGFMGMTIAFIFIYAKRTLMMAFLTIVAPLVGISYTVDKIKDGQSQILDKWTKEYIYTALIMPLDALLFTIVSSILMDLVSSDGNIILGLAILFGYLPLRGWFTEFIGADRAGHSLGAVAAASFIGNKLANVGGSDASKRKGDNSRSNTTNESNGGLPGGGGSSGSTGLPGGGGSSGSTGLPGSGGSSGSTGLPGGGGSSGGAGNRATVSPSSYGANGNKGDLKTRLKSGFKGGVNNLGHKTARGALNMAENNAARVYGAGKGLAKGALKATTAMLFTGSPELAMQQFSSGMQSGYRSGRNNMLNRMDSIEEGAKNIAGIATGTDAKRGILQQEYDQRASQISDYYDNENSNINSEFENQSRNLDIIENSNSLDDLNSDLRKDAINYARESVDDNEYLDKVNQLGQKGADKWAFQEAKNNGQLSENISKARTAASINRDNRIATSNEKRNNDLSALQNPSLMSRSNVARQYRNNVNNASSEAVRSARQAGYSNSEAVNAGAQVRKNARNERREYKKKTKK